MAQESQERPDWRDWIKRGMEAYRHARYAEAISAFQAASESNLQNPVPHLYLALGWLQQYVSGALDPDVVEHARRAEAELRRALDVESINWITFVLLGHLAFQQGRLEEAREWYGKALPVAPRQADIWYTLGTIALQQWLRQGKQPNAPPLEEAILAFEKSISLDPVQDNSMQCLNMVLRERAGTCDRDESRREDQAAADRWLEKSGDARAEKIHAAIARPVSPSLDFGDLDAFLQQWASMMLTFPPPLPPTAPPRGFRGRRTSGGTATVRWEPVPRGADQPPPPIRVAPAVQAQKLITKVEPDYLAYAEVEAPMRFVVVIGKDGHVARETLISGNIWLVQTAVEALRQWVYEPTLVDGTPVEVVTEVRVEFRAG